MSDLSHGLIPAARSVSPLACVVIVTAVLGGLAGLLSATGSSAPALQASTAGAREVAHKMAMPSARATGVTRAGTSIPDASAVFAGRDEVVDEPAPTF